MTDDDRREALAWFNDASSSIAQKVAALRGADPDLPAAMPDILGQLDRWWDRRTQAERDALTEEPREDFGRKDQQMVVDANEDKPPIVAIAADHATGRFWLPTILAVYLELKSQWA